MQFGIEITPQQREILKQVFQGELGRLDDLVFTVDVDKLKEEHEAEIDKLLIQDQNWKNWDFVTQSLKEESLIDPKNEESTKAREIYRDLIRADMELPALILRELLLPQIEEGRSFIELNRDFFGHDSLARFLQAGVVLAEEQQRKSDSLVIDNLIDELDLRKWIK